MKENGDDEVEQYLAIAQIPKDQDSLKWWNANQRQFPILAQIARKYLSIQATSGASEHIFSEIKYII
ncbi:unnamed protein product [Rhizophagus irregularis]|nr:unnamed protein product [Rhizophagus irregularis]